MSISIIVMGAKVRMGSTIAGLVRADRADPVGVVEREGCEDGLYSYSS
jgi:dihydrodipicolinate reductase